MKTTLSLLALFAVSAHGRKHESCYQKPDYEVETVELDKLTPVDLPDNWLWNDAEGVNYLTNIRNQHIPQYCGSCWAHATTSAFSDRIKIMRQAAWPDINIAPQVLISCSEKGNQGCHGGYQTLAYRWMYENTFTDETCSIYRARGHDNGEECSAEIQCLNCNPSGPCFVPDWYYVYKAQQYGEVKGEDDMLQEVFQRGPIACGVAVPDSLLNYTGGIYNDTTGNKDIDHVVSVVGFGVENGVKYWKVRNSWGSHWGEDGFFRIVRGVDNIGIEEQCAWAVPEDTWTNPWIHNTTEAEKNDPKNKRAQPNYPENEGFLSERACKAGPNDFGKDGERKPDQMAWDIVSADELPENWDWRNINNTNFLGWSKNQHIPEYCGSCWAQAATSALGDRFNIMLGNQNPTPIDLSAQVLINCNGGGTCNGGNAGGAYHFAYTQGLPDSSCMQYVAHNLDHDYPCQDIDICRDCSPPIPAANDSGLEGCYAVPYKHYYASHYYFVRTAEHMKAEIYLNGPIACAIEATTQFENNYTGGIYSQHIDNVQLNHDISVVGWGKDAETGEEYWVGRNSWGTYWGENGYFRMKMYEDNLGIETDCAGALPSFEAPTSFSEFIFTE